MISAIIDLQNIINISRGNRDHILKYLKQFLRVDSRAVEGFEN